MEYRTLLAAAQALAPQLSEIRQKLHRIPEPARKEVKTAACIAAVLRQLPGVTVRENVFATGILAELQGRQPGPVVVLRADMDALNITEETGLPFASEHPGMMHACGHDFHVTGLLGAAMLLAQNRDALQGTVRFLFQPSEEYSPVGGSRGMIEAGALQGVDAVFGLHVWPGLPFGTVGVKPGPIMACSDHFTVEIEGKSSHAAQPDQGVDALQAGCQFAVMAQSIVSRNISPVENAVISIGKIHAGTRYNIVAQSCMLEGTARSFEPQVRDEIEAGLRRMLEGVCAANGCTGVLNFERGYSPTINHPDMADYVARTAGALYGEAAVEHLALPAMTAEDFGFYLERVPGCFFWLGADMPGEPVWPLHSSHLNLNEGLLPRGAALLAALALNFVK